MHTTIIGGQAAVDKYRADYAWAAGALRRHYARMRAGRTTRTILDHALPVRPLWAMARDRRTP
jgi:hypothetical protein